MYSSEVRVLAQFAKVVSPDDTMLKITTTSFRLKFSPLFCSSLSRQSHYVLVMFHTHFGPLFYLIAKIIERYKIIGNLQPMSQEP
jgi:hypothetical protein